MFDVSYSTIISKLNNLLFRINFIKNLKQSSTTLHNQETFKISFTKIQT